MEAEEISFPVRPTQISAKRRVTVASFRGQVLVSIREFFMREETELPSRKGIALTEDQWGALLSQLDYINQAIIKKKHSLKNQESILRFAE